MLKKRELDIIIALLKQTEVYVGDIKVRELIAVKVLYTSLLYTTVVAFKVLTDASA